MRLGLLTIAALCSACIVHTPVPQARVTLGPARGAALDKILALPTDCQAETAELCTPAQAIAVDAAARMSLEFAGVRIVDSEVVNAYLRHRVTTEINAASRSEVESERATWATASDATRRRLLAEMGIDGYLTTRISVGHVKNLEGQRTLSVTVSIIRAADAAPAWTSRCSIETGRYYFADEAVELAARCALESALMVSS